MWWGNTAPTFNVVMLLNALQQGDQQSSVKAARKGNILAGALGFLCGALVLVVYLGVGVYSLWVAWQTGDWSNVWMPLQMPMLMVLPFIILIPLLRVWPPFTKQQEILLSGSRGIREALALNDDHLMPPVPLQPAPLAPEDLAAGAVRIGPLRRLAIGKPVGVGALATLIFLPLALLFALLPLIFFPSGDDLGPFSFNIWDSSFFEYFPFALLLLMVLPITVAVIIGRLRTRGKGLFVTVDAQGIQWQHLAPLKGEARIPWDHVRSISRIVYSGAYSNSGAYNYGASAYPSVGWGMSTAYLLEAPEVVLVWTVSAFSKPEDVVASETLLRAAVTHTGKSLRELTGFATEIAQAGGNVGYILASRLPASVTGGAFAPFMPGQQVKRRPRIWPWLAAAVVVLLLGSLYGGGAWVQSYQPTYLSNLPAQIHAENPLYHDDLTRRDGFWIEKAPDKDDSSGFAYANGGYQVSGTQPGFSIESLNLYQQFGDTVAYEVTATQSGTMKKDSGDGVGIAFNSNQAQDDFMMFTVATTGYWQIVHYKYVDDRPDDNWNYVTSGRSAAIHAGQGQTNRLLLVVRGHYFLVYINDQFVKSYDTRYDTGLPTSGYAGVILDDSMLVGTFKNFSVYPVKPATFPNWQYV